METEKEKSWESEGPGRGWSRRASSWSFTRGRG